jgi:hypothetical protein
MEINEQISGGERAIVFNKSRENAIRGLTQLGIITDQIPDIIPQDRKANPVEAAIYNLEVLTERINPIVYPYFSLRPTAEVVWKKSVLADLFVGKYLGYINYNSKGMRYHFLDNKGEMDTRLFDADYIKQLWNPQDTMNQEYYRKVVEMFASDSIPQLIRRFQQAVR